MRTPEEARKATAAQARYDADHTRRITLKLNTGTDADVIAWLEAQPSMQGAVKDLIRNILKQGEKPMANKQKQYDYIDQWQNNNYDKVLVRFPKGTKERIAATGKTLNGFIVEIVLAKLAEIESNNPGDIPPQK